MRLCIPERISRRGAGLGNELIPWAKAFLASQALGAGLMNPAWGLNRRGYRHYFNTSKFDWLKHEMLRMVMPVINFTENDYLETGEHDFQFAVEKFAKIKKLELRSHFLFSVGGMWGGFLSIRKARVFILKELLNARRSVENVQTILSRRHDGKVFVAVHIRRGDFSQANSVDSYRGQFNTALPLEWYMATCRSIRKSLHDQVEFLLLTDAAPAEVQQFIEEFQPLTTFQLKQTACSDLLLMAFSDCIVCSVSSYSMWGAYLSDGPYIWFGPNLQNEDGYASLWGHENRQAPPFGATALNYQRMLNADKVFADMNVIGRGIAVDQSGAVPPQFCERLIAKKYENAIEADLIFYGVIKMQKSAA